jgi:hypothetical protein
MRNLIILFVCLVVVGCNATTAKKQETQDAAKKVIQAQKTTIAGASYSKKIQGIWIDTAGEANFDIRKNTIYYPRHQKGYKYSVTPDSLKIFYDDFTYVAKIYFIKDTLVMDSHEFGISKYTKPKN